MSSAARAALLAFLLLPLSPAYAQHAPEQANPEEIVVTGRQFEEQVRDFVYALTPARTFETVSRFEESICPAVRGLSASQNEAVFARVRTVGEAAGLRIARAGCTPNSLLVVTDDKARFITALASARPWFFGDMAPAQIRRLARSPGRSAAWQLKGLVDAGGHPIAFDASVGYYRNRTSQGASRLRPGGRWVFEGTMLVVERGALDGLNTIQLADFAAMRLFAGTDPARVARTGAPTILNILEAPMGSAIPLTLTTWDLAFLRGLYASPTDVYAASQRSAIRDDMRDALQPSPEDN